MNIMDPNEMATIYTINVKEYECVQVTVDNIPRLINWLGNDLYAITNGQPIVIGNNEIANTDDASPVQGIMTNMLVVISNPVEQKLHVVAKGDWIVKDQDVGYLIYSDKIFKHRFTIGQQVED